MRIHRAFTLVELLVVIIILSVVAAIVLPRLTDSSLRAREARLKQQLVTLREAADRFHADTGLYPLSGSDLMAETAPALGLSKKGTKETIPPGSFRGPYIDDWGRCPFCHGAYEIETSPPKAGWISTTCSGSGSNGKPYSQW